MPQLVKGGKYVFGWSKVGEDGRIVIPPEAYDEYHLEDAEKVILMPGSKTSGGFGLAKVEGLRGSRLAAVLEEYPVLTEFTLPEGEVIKVKRKYYCWVQVRNREIRPPLITLQNYGIKPGGRFLVVRGSHLAIGFIARGLIVEEAKLHPEIEVFE